MIVHLHNESMPSIFVKEHANTGHMPQLETPDQLMHAIWDCADTDFTGQRDLGLN